MNWEHYIVDHRPYDWARLLGPWADRLDVPFGVKLLSAFGDLFLEYPDGSVHWLETGADTVTRIDDAWEPCLKRFADMPEWLSRDLADRCREHGLTLDGKSVYALAPPSPAGKANPEIEAEIMPVEAFFTAAGARALKQRGHPDAAHIQTPQRD